VHSKAFGNVCRLGRFWKCRLWCFSKFCGVEWQQLEQISCTNRSQAFRWKLILPPSQRKILKRKVSDAWQTNYRTLNWITRFSSRMFWLICQTWHHMNMSKRICRRLAKSSLTSFLLEHFRCTLPAPSTPLTSYIQNLCRFWECCFKGHIKKISYWKAHLETVIFRTLASRLKFICHIRAK